MLKNASYILKKKQNQTSTKKEKSLNRQESKPRPSTCKSNALSIAPSNRSYEYLSN